MGPLFYWVVRCFIEATLGYSLIIVRRPGRTCKHVRARFSHPTTSGEVHRPQAITHAAT